MGSSIDNVISKFVVLTPSFPSRLYHYLGFSIYFYPYFGHPPSPHPEKTSFMDGPYVVVACQRQSAKIVCKHRIAWPWSLENSVTSWSVNIVSNVVICLIHLVEILSYLKFLILMGLHFQEKYLKLSSNCHWIVFRVLWLVENVKLTWPLAIWIKVRKPPH